MNLLWNGLSNIPSDSHLEALALALQVRSSSIRNIHSMRSTFGLLTELPFEVARLASGLAQLLCMLSLLGIRAPTHRGDEVLQVRSTLA